MKFTNHVGLVRETGAGRRFRPANRAILKASEGAMQPLNAKRAFRGQADLLPQSRVQRPDGQAELRGHILDASASTQGKLRGAVMAHQFAYKEI